MYDKKYIPGRKLVAARALEIERGIRMSVERIESRQALKYIRNYFRSHDELNHKQVIRMIASESDTPPEVLKAMAQSTTRVDILERIASHPNTPDEVLHRLATHAAKEIRLAVASNINAAPIAVNPLVSDESPTVRFTLAGNHSTEEIILRELMDDENPFVSVRAEQTIDRVNRESRL